MRAEVARLLYNESRAPIKKLEVFGEDVPHGAAARLYPEAYGALLVGFLDRVLETRAVDSR